MKHFDYETPERKQEIFFKEPESFTKYTDKETLSYALGADFIYACNKEKYRKGCD